VAFPTYFAEYFTGGTWRYASRFLRNYVTNILGTTALPPTFFMDLNQRFTTSLCHNISTLCDTTQVHDRRNEFSVTFSNGVIQRTGTPIYGMMFLHL